MKLCAKEFAEYWVGFIQNLLRDNIDWETRYNDNKIWTMITIGEKESNSNNSPFGQHISEITGLRYRKEDGLADLTFSNINNFIDVFSLHENEKDRELVIRKNTYYPSHYEVILEHENNIYRCYEEMIKLTYDRARLKVLITYNEDAESNCDYHHANEILSDNFGNIIVQANKKYNENPETEYLLIIGQKKGNSLSWEKYIFDTNGNKNR